MEQVFNPPVIVANEIAGKEGEVRQQLENLIKQIDRSQFDIGDLLKTIKKNNYYHGYETFFAYTRSLKLKDSKVRYLTRISEVTEKLGIPRDKYEHLGTAKMRAITSLDVDGIYKNPETGAETPITVFIEGFIEKGADMSLEEIHNHVKTLKGLVGDEAMGWVHLYMKQLAIDNVVRPALELAKLQIGSSTKDEDGNSIDPSDGRALEVIAVEYLNDKNNQVQEM